MSAEAGATPVVCDHSDYEMQMVNFNAVEVFLKQFLLYIQADGVAAVDSVAIPAAVSPVDLLDEDWGSGLNSFRMSD